MDAVAGHALTWCTHIPLKSGYEEETLESCLSDL